MEEIIKQQLGHIVPRHIHSLFAENIRNTDKILPSVCAIALIVWFSMGSIGFYVEKLAV